MSKGIVLTGRDDHLEELATSKGYNVRMDPQMTIVWDKTLFVAPETQVPWDLLPAAWHFLTRWDAAVPLWRYGVTAEDVGSAGERKRTKAVVRDLRVLLHAVELLFVHDNEAGQSLMHVYRAELESSEEKRLAFLRAVYQVKPRLCVLPRSWLAKIYERSKMDARHAQRPHSSRLVSVEVAPGKFVKCNPGDEEKVLEMMQQRRGRRHG